MTGVVRAEAGSENEYKIKTAVIFKLLKFIDFPVVEKDDATPRELVIGVCGGAQEAFDAMLALRGMTVKGRKISVRNLSVIGLLGTKKPAPMVYDLLWIPRPSLSQKKPFVVKDLLERLKSPDALTIGEVSGFIDGGGIINLLKEKNRIGFEINLVEAKRAQLKINSSVLKLAKRVITPPKDD